MRASIFDASVQARGRSGQKRVTKAEVTRIESREVIVIAIYTN